MTNTTIIICFLYALLIACIKSTAATVPTSSKSATLDEEPSIQNHRRRNLRSDIQDEDHPSNNSQRRRVRTRTTLLNLNIDALTPHQIICFEETWANVFNEVMTTITDDGTVIGPVVRSFVVEEIQANESNEDPLSRRRQLLRGVPEEDLRSSSIDHDTKRALGSRGLVYWFDIYGTRETTCNMCANANRRLAKAKDLDELFESKLLERLRVCPSGGFEDLTDCRVVNLA